MTTTATIVATFCVVNKVWVATDNAIEIVPAADIKLGSRKHTNQELESHSTVRAATKRTVCFLPFYPG